MAIRSGLPGCASRSHSACCRGVATCAAMHVSTRENLMCAVR